MGAGVDVGAADVDALGVRDLLPVAVPVGVGVAPSDRLADAVELGVAVRVGVADADA